MQLLLETILVLLEIITLATLLNQELLNQEVTPFKVLEIQNQETQVPLDQITIVILHLEAIAEVILRLEAALLQEALEVAAQEVDLEVEEVDSNLLN